MKEHFHLPIMLRYVITQIMRGSIEINLLRPSVNAATHLLGSYPLNDTNPGGKHPEIAMD